MTTNDDDKNICHICFCYYGGCFNPKKMMVLICKHSLCHKCYAQIVQRSIDLGSEVPTPSDITPRCPWCRVALCLAT